MSRRPARHLAAAVLTAAALLLSACSDGDAPDAAPAPGERSSDASAPASTVAPDQSLGGAGSRQGDLPTLPDAEQGELLGAFVNFALRPDTQSAESVAFADQVDLGLGTEVRRTISGSDLGNPRRWLLPTEGYAGRDRFLSALRTLTSQAQRAVREQRDTGIFVTVAGEHDQCAGEPSPPLAGYEIAQQLAVMPGARSIESCAEWFAVDLYTDDAGDIAAVRLDLVEP